VSNAFDRSINKAAQFFLASEALTRSLITSMVAVVVLCPGINPDWFILRIQLSDEKEQSYVLSKDSRILAKQCILEMGR
jgi:hypothetical protein